MALPRTGAMDAHKPSIDSATGKLVESYLQKPVALKPFAAVEIFISQNDIRGGTGAIFIVDWGAEGQIAEPVVEALMLGGIGNV